MSRVWIASVVLSVAATVPVARAQDRESAAAPALTIAEAIDEALAHNLSMFAERSGLAIADAAAITPRPRPNPVVSLSADHHDVLRTAFVLRKHVRHHEYPGRLHM